MLVYQRVNSIQKLLVFCLPSFGILWYSPHFFDTYANPVLPLFPCRWKQFNSTALDRMRLGWVPRVWGDMGFLQLEDRVVSPFYMIKTSEKGSSIPKFTWSPIISKTLYHYINMLRF